MKKTISALLATALTLTLSACGGKTPPKSDGRLMVYTSFYAMQSFAEEIGGDMAAVYSVCPQGTDPHSYVPDKSELEAISGADIFVYNGMGMEAWAADALESLAETDTIIVEAAQSVQNIAEDYDPHVWLDPSGAYEELYAITNAFIQADPENSDYYSARLEICRGSISALIEKYSTMLEDYRGETIVTAHRAFFPMCNAFGLTQISVNEFDNTQNPAPMHIDEVEGFIESNEIKYIFDEPLSKGSAIKQIAKDTGCEILILDPFEGGSNKDYFTTMEDNLNALKTALY